MAREPEPELSRQRHAPVRRGTAHPNIVPYQAFATADGHVMLAVGNDAQFGAFLCRDRQAGARRGPALCDQWRPRGEPWNPGARYSSDCLRVRTSAEWLAALKAAQVPCGPINDLAQVFAEPQVKHRGLRIDLPHPTAGSVPGVRNPVVFGRTPVAYDRAPPPLGADTDAVLAERLGLGAGAAGQPEGAAASSREAGPVQPEAAGP